MKHTISFDLSWLILLLVILKLTNVIHISWWWIIGPWVALLVLSAVFAFCVTSIVALALKYGHVVIKKSLDK